jgi:SAM-dependent methyltransferase
MSSARRSAYDEVPDFGVLYDSVPAYGARADVQFYVAEAALERGSVLELGCGTGRILIPIARTGAVIAGLDGSEHMLAQCRAKLRRETAETQARVTLQLGDARGFDLRTRFGLVLAPFRMFQHLVTIDDQLNCLSCIAQHLETGGRLIFDVFNPHFSKLTIDRSAEQEDTPAFLMSDGRVLRRTYRIAQVRWVDQVNETELIYYVAPAADAPAERFVHRFELRWFLRSELEHLLARSGFRVHAIFGGFDRSPLTDDAPKLIVVAERL